LNNEADESVHALTLRFGILLAAGLIASDATLAATYRWIDENGKVQYGDVMPSSQAGQGHAELDQQGRVVKDVKRTRLTPEERQRQAEAAAREAEAKRKQLEQRRHDMALLSTYASEKEIELAQNRAIELENLNIRGLQTRMDVAAAKLSFANANLQRHSNVRQAAPAGYVQMRNEAQAELAQISESLRQRNQAIEDIKLRYQEDSKRFLELKAQQGQMPAR
jgi:multidrug resistance efflux pump